MKTTTTFETVFKTIIATPFIVAISYIIYHGVILGNFSNGSWGL